MWVLKLKRKVLKKKIFHLACILSSQKFQYSSLLQYIKSQKLLNTVPTYTKTLFKTFISRYKFYRPCVQISSILYEYTLNYNYS